MVPTIFALLVVFQIKHFLADYPLQTEYMLGKFQKERWILPLTLHCFTHAGFTYYIVYFTAVGLVVGQWKALSPGGRLLAYDPLYLGIGLALLDFVSHFIMDRVKASPTLLGRWKALSALDFRANKHMAGYTSKHPELVLARKHAADRLRGNKLFWWALGFDQMWHHLTDYLIIYILVTGIR